MKTRIIGFFAALALMFALTFPAGAPAAAPAAKGAVVTAQPAAPERHPEIRAAIESLEHARAFEGSTARFRRPSRRSSPGYG